MRIFDFNSALVREPGRSVVEGLCATPGPRPVFEELVAEHQAYINALRTAGVDVTVLDPLEAFPDSIFVEDPALVFSEAAILLRPGAPSRTAEAEALAPSLQARFPRILQLTRGFADGGDILVTPDRVLIGLSARTDRAGADSLRDLLASVGRESQIVAVPRGTLRLKTDCALIDEETVLATEALAASGILDGFRTLIVPAEERAAANALRANDVMFVSAAAPRTAAMLAAYGVNVVPLPVTQIGRLDAGLSCLSLRWFDAARR